MKPGFFTAVFGEMADIECHEERYGPTEQFLIQQPVDDRDFGSLAVRLCDDEVRRVKVASEPCGRIDDPDPFDRALATDYRRAFIARIVKLDGRIGAAETELADFYAGVLVGDRLKRGPTRRRRLEADDTVESVFSLLRFQMTVSPMCEPISRKTRTGFV